MYRPVAFCDIFGQSLATARLAEFAQAPEPAAFIFSGPTGVGKSASAEVLARALGCSVEDGEIGGYWVIPSGEQNGAAIRALLEHLLFPPWLGSGWRFVLLNEADHMTEKAAITWLDVLERIPSRTVFCFTTNAPMDMERRFRERCEHLEFSGNPDAQKGAADALVARIWADAGRRDNPPSAAEFDCVEFDGCFGSLSFRSLARAAERAANTKARRSA